MTTTVGTIPATTQPVTAPEKGKSGKTIIAAGTALGKTAAVSIVSGEPTVPTTVGTVAGAAAGAAAPLFGGPTVPTVVGGAIGTTGAVAGGALGTASAVVADPFAGTVATGYAVYKYGGKVIDAVDKGLHKAGEFLSNTWNSLVK